MFKKLKANKGFSTLIFLSLLLMLSLLGINAIMTSTTEVDIAGYELNTTKAFYAAEAALEQASSEIKAYYNKFGRPPETMPSGTLTFGDHIVTYATTKPGPTVNKTLRQGAYRGLYGLSDEYFVTATATSPGVKAQTTLVITVDATIVPVYQFAVFYEDDLEIAPGPPMTLGGRVHSNMDLYLQSGNSLTITDYTTAAGNIFHGRSPVSGQSTSYGDVLIEDKNGNNVNMKQTDGTWLDSTDPDWVEKSIANWGGQVEDKDHGITELNLPVVASGEPVDMIHRDGGGNADSYEHKAGLKIIDGNVKWKNSDSNWVDVTADFTASGILTNTSFHDGREGKDVSSYDIDIAKLNASSYWPSTGIVYTANSGGGGYTGTRLVNGSELAGPLTFASEDPLYTLGNYNTVNKKPASIMTDAYTVLSENWSDANSWSGISSRTAGNTTVNAAYMTGNKSSGAGGGSSYSGGFENLPRFLESWSNKTFSWTGSAVDLWQSEKAVGYWSYGNYYRAPNRNWSFDTDFLDPSKLPPGTPVISVVMKTTWKKTIAYNP